MFQKLCHWRSCLSGGKTQKLIITYYYNRSDVSFHYSEVFKDPFIVAYCTEINAKNRKYNKYTELFRKQISTLQILCILIVIIIINPPKSQWQGLTWIIRSYLCKFLFFSELDILFPLIFLKIQSSSIQNWTLLNSYCLSPWNSTFVLGRKTV